MRATQKLIKLFAMVLAIVIIVSIFAAIVGGVGFLAALSGDGDFPWSQETGAWVSSGWTEQEIRELDLNVKATSVKFLVRDEGDPIVVDTNNEYITSWTSGKTLNIVEKSHGMFGWGGVGELVIYVREGVSFENVNIEVGAGALNIEALETRNLRLNLGAGKTSVNKLTVKETAKIDGGAGMMEVRDGDLRNVELEMGAGKAEIRTKLGGRNKIETGVGRLELKLLGDESDYKLRIDKGIGSVELNGRSVGDGTVWGDGNVLVDIESGVGAVEIKTEKE